MKWLITGGCGFIGMNAAMQLRTAGDEVVVVDSLRRPQAHRNLSSLRDEFAIECNVTDIRDAAEMGRLLSRHADFDVVLHLAGQVSLLASLADPRYDFEANALGTINVLEAVRAHAPDAVVIYSGTNKVYGDLDHLTTRETATRFELVDFPLGVSEQQPLDFKGGYGCSKGAADQYVLDYHRSHGLRTVSLRQSSIYGGHQYATTDQGWVAFFAKMGVLSEPFTINGSGKQVRDVLHVDDLIECFRACVRAIDRCQGTAMNVGGGPSNSLSLLELFDLLRTRFDLSLEYQSVEPRPGDQKVFIADSRRAADSTGWSPSTSVDDGLDQLVEWTRRAYQQTRR